MEGGMGRRAWGIAICVLVWALPGVAGAQADARLTARAHLEARREALGLESADLERAELVGQRTNPRTRASHFFYRQRLHGLDVVGADLGVTVDARGRVLADWSRAVAGLAQRAPDPEPGSAPETALARAAAQLGLPLPPGSARTLQPPVGTTRAGVLAAPTASLDPVPVRLAYLALPDREVALVWNLVLRAPDGLHWWDAYVDATSGELLDASDWIDRDSYRVFAPPVEDPDDGGRSLEVDPADPTASPFGWHDEDGVAGAEYTDTRGNNVRAQEDTNANNSGGFRPSSGSLEFDFPLDLGQPPSGYQSAAITNLFYWNNLAHDLFYQYGFDEASGNFQTNNYGHGGIAGDAVRADAQDGSGTNNANFGTPPDGSPPRMQMFRWIAPVVDVTAPAAIAGGREAGTATFGPALDDVGVTGSVVQALDLADADGPSTTDACSALTNAGAVSGAIAMVDRGDCFFRVKVKNCQDAGAIGVIVVNNEPGTLTMAGDDASIVIPSLLIDQEDGAEIEAELGGGVTATLRVLVDRDSDLDSGVLVHEYAHGVTNRLTGGAGNTSCLDDTQAGGMGEGWSDFFGLAFTARPGDAAEDPRPIGSYLNGASGGIRTAPYSTDLAVNPLTYADIATQGFPHGIGEVWAVTLWELYWNLVDTYGFDADLYAGASGNHRALGLVMDALSIQPCEPDFLDARDALLTADLAATGGVDECRIWDAFARRGMGASASSPGSGSAAVTESFDLPVQCLPATPAMPWGAHGAVAALLALVGRLGLGRRSRRG